MSWWGKIVGGVLGYVILGPFGALLGVVIGNQFDAGMYRLGNFDRSAKSWVSGNQERVQTTFFTALFSVMGYVAKADGVVTQDEIAMAKSVMQQMSLNKTQTRIAIELFNKGKHTGFQLDEILKQLKFECRNQRNVMQMFLEVLLQAAYADGIMHPNEKNVLHHIADELGFTQAELEHIEAIILGHNNAANTSNGISLDDAYAILDVSKNASDAQVKKAYRRMMNQHHPDKLVSKGLPEEMIKLATEKTQDIKAAYEKIKNS
ncbi:DnaJ-like protein DjlA [hydrothermal vent metagenome]|uniref:DnaJ-like protein DjlA n=1 Tax=hydrothermal vent metagenome TaxID=652676 RepID=A0A3B0ZFJ0_9ZZZZ